MVVLMSSCPSISWAMCGGMPLRKLVESIVARVLNTLTGASGGMLFPSFVMAGHPPAGEHHGLARRGQGQQVLGEVVACAGPVDADDDLAPEPGRDLPEG